MKSVSIPLLACILTGCLASNALEYSTAADTNVHFLSKVRKGMSEKEVLCLMKKPYRYESHQVGEDTYDIWFYVTKMTGLDQTRMVPQNLTPLTFKNGCLVGTGYSWVHFVMDGQVEVKNTPPEKPKSQEIENKSLEETLKTPPPQPVTTQREILATLPLGDATPKAFKSLRLGMREEEVAKKIGQPMNSETYHINGNVFDIWFYEAGPLSFKNGILVGTSERDYQRIKAKQDQIDGYTREAERMEEDESEQNFDFW